MPSASEPIPHEPHESHESPERKKHLLARIAVKRWHAYIEGHSSRALARTREPVHARLLLVDAPHLHAERRRKPPLCHPERSEGSFADDEQGSLAPLGMTGCGKGKRAGNDDHARQPTRVAINPLLRSLLTTYRWPA